MTPSDPVPRLSETFAARSAYALLALLCYAVLVLWVSERWAVAIFQTGVFALAAVWAIRMLVRPFRPRWTPLFLPMAGIPLWGAVQLLTGRTVYRWQTWDSVILWSAHFVVFLVAAQAFAYPEVRRRFLRLAFCFAFALSVVSTLQLFTSNGKVFWLFPSGYTDFVLGPFVSRNQYAAFIELLLPVGLWRVLSDGRRLLIFVPMTGAMVASVFASGSRAGSALVVVEALVVLGLALVRRRLHLRAAALAVGGLVVMSVLFTAVVGWDVLWDRLRQPDPFAVRREILRSSLAMVAERPVMGFGLGNWATVYPGHALYDDGTVVNQAHNDWVQWAAEGGIPLALMLLALALFTFPPAVRSYWGLGTTAVWLHCLVDYPLQRPALAAWLFVFLGMLAARREAASSRRSHRSVSGTAGRRADESNATQ